MKRTRNETIMDFIIEYAKVFELNDNILRVVNQVRIFKRVFLLFEIIGKVEKNNNNFKYNIKFKS